MDKVKIKQLKEIEILSSRFKITWDKRHDGGSFSYNWSSIIIGTRSIKHDSTYTLSIISHEIIEIILLSMGGRFENGRIGENYLFNFSHQTFENAIQIHTQIITKFLY